MRWFSTFSILAFTAAGGCFLLIAIAHVSYPGFTESMEGDVLQHVERAAHGRTIYPEPGADYIALAYMPLYYVLAAPFYWIFGDRLMGPRLLSVLCALASAALVGRIAARETGSRATGLLSAAFFCAGYRIMDACLFCALPDALLLFWLLLGYWFWAYGTTRFADFLWLLCFTLAFWTKQHGAFFFGAAVLYALLFRKNALPRWSILWAIVLGGPLAYFLLGRMLGDRFVYHTLTVPGKWEHDTWKSLRRTAFVLACFAPLAAAASLDLVWRNLRRGDWKPTPLGWFTASALGISLVTMAASGSSNNHYVPLLAMLSAVLAIQCHHLAIPDARSQMSLPLIAVLLPSIVIVTFVSMNSFIHHEIPFFAPIALGIATLTFIAIEQLPLVPARRSVAGVVILVICQFAVCYYPPLRFLPRPGWREATAKLDGELSRLDGPVIWLTYGRAPADYLNRKLEPAPSWVTLGDIERQINNKEQTTRDLAPFLERIRRSHGLYLLTDTKIADHTADRKVWELLQFDVTLIRDFGDEFDPVRQIADHWYVIPGSPRYLYRVK